MKSAANAILTKARAMYGRHITEDQYDALTQRSSVSDVVSYLISDTAYADAFENARHLDIHRQKLESLLDDEAFRRLERLQRYADRKDRDFYNLGIIRREWDIVMHVARAIQYGRTDEMKSIVPPAALVRHSTLDFKKLREVTSFEDLAEVCEKTIYGKPVRETMNAGHDRMPKMEHALQCAFYDHCSDTINRLCRGEVRDDLNTILSTVIELSNITKIYRLKAYFNAPPEAIRPTLMTEHTRMSKTMLESLVNAPDAEAMLMKLANSKYAQFADRHDYVYIEYAAQSISYHLAKRHMRFSSKAPVVYMTYVILQTMEIDNLKHIVEGIRYNQSPETIRRLLIY